MIRALGMMAALILPLTATVGAGEESEWEFTKEKKGVKLYKMRVPGTRLVAFKGEGLVEFPPAKIMTVLMDAHRSTEWVDRLKESSVLEAKSPIWEIQYGLVKTPPIIMKKRDFVLEVKASVVENPRRLILTFVSVEHPDKPEIKKYIRGKVLNSRFIVTPRDGGKTGWLEAEIHADPQGSIPIWVVNMFQKSWPLKTIVNLRKFLEEPNIPEKPVFREMLRHGAIPDRWVQGEL